MSTGGGDPLELLGLAEIAAQNNVSAQAVYNWTKRYEDFPEPIARLRMGPVFDAKEVYEWITRHFDI